MENTLVTVDFHRLALERRAAELKDALWNGERGARSKPRIPAGDPIPTGRASCDSRIRSGPYFHCEAHDLVYDSRLGCSKCQYE